ncbi:MAG: hypothetical protein JW794_03465 [Candidatus Cloacimonetes bacterium]|nr:hypothetical protein [Candidatus Cloacimonadota bacterium]
MIRKLILIGYLFLSFGSTLASSSLKEVYEVAPAYDDYDKYMVLETGVTYTGGLLIGKIFDPITAELSDEIGMDVRIVGNGAILNLQGEEICISYCTNKLDIDNCIIINGNIRYRGINLPPDEIYPSGYVKYCTFFKPQDYGIRLQGAGGNITIARNLIVDAVDTGWDFHYLHGTSLEYLPTGANVCISVFYSTYGVPVLLNNWSFHSDPVVNADLTKHFVALCEYG